MPVVKIGLWAGRDKETKKKLIENVTKTVCDTIGCLAQAVIAQGELGPGRPTGRLK